MINVIASMRIIHLFLIFIFSNFCFSEYLENLAIKKVVDGDTVHIYHKNEIYKVRLIEIDAPERNQPFGSDSTDYLKSLLREGRVNIEISGTDRYGRKLGRLYWKGENINRAMVSAGYAWVYDDYVTDLSFYDDQNQARYLKKGLWSEESPMAPWNWRKLTK